MKHTAINRNKMFQSKTRVGPAKLFTFGVAGFVIGIILGYLFMGTVHAVGPSRTVFSVDEPGSVLLEPTTT